jgi:xylulokinase
MKDQNYVFSYDIGTTGNKTCLYRIAPKIELVDSCVAEYPLYILPDGGAEQNVDDWWDAICKTTNTILSRVKLDRSAIRGIAFCCQMQGSILVDSAGQPLRNPMIWMDIRATRQIEEFLYTGLIRISGYNALIALKSLRITGALAGTAKDPLWKYHWVRENEPEIFRKVYKWLDVKDFLLLRCTGHYGMTRDSAHLTFLYDTRLGRLGWHKGLCHTFRVDMRHLPPVVRSTDVVGGLTKEAADAIGLNEGTRVFGGGGDLPLITIGSGCVEEYDTHIYIGTSGWVAANVERRILDITNFMGSIIGAMPGCYVFVAEQETSGVCLQWIRDLLALEKVVASAEKDKNATEKEEPKDAYDVLNKAAGEMPPGAGNIIFTPWLQGNRSPREDPYARGMFFNIGLKAGTGMLIRAVMEGVAYHNRWMLQAFDKKIPRQNSIRLVGGGAKSEVWCQIMADVTGRTIETIENPQNAGAFGAAVVSGVGLGLLSSFHQAKSFIPVKRRYTPRSEFKEIYSRNFKAFQELYKNNKKLFRLLNQFSTTDAV